MRILRAVASVLIAGLMLVPLATSAQGAELRLLEPMPDAVILGDSVTVIFEVSGVQIVPSPVKPEESGKRPDANRPNQGHLHLTLDLNPVVVWDKSDPYIFMNVPPGRHVLTVELVNNDSSSRTPPIVLQQRLEVRPDSVSGEQDVIRSLPNTGSLVGSSQERLLLMLVATTLVILGLGLQRSVANEMWGSQIG